MLMSTIPNDDDQNPQNPPDEGASKEERRVPEDFGRHFLRETNVRQVALWIVILIGGVFLVGVICILVAANGKTPVAADSIERIVLPTITGLIGVLGGLYLGQSARS
jgi:drug/metabolite transporter (DMT)-like permease